MIERDVVTRDHSRCDVYHPSQPRATNWLAIKFVNDNYVYESVIDLN